MFGMMQDMPTVTEAEYKMVERNLGPDRPSGLVAQVAGAYEGGWRIISVWTDEDAYRRFDSDRRRRAVGLAAQEDRFDPAKAAGFQVSTVSGIELPF